MPSARRPRIGIIASQFAAYHVDRCRAVALRLEGRADVVAVEVATTSQTYAWEASGNVEGAEKVTLFPGESYETIGIWRRFRAELSALRHCDVVCVGIGYNEPDIILLSWALRLLGKHVIVLTESKFDDFPRNLRRERLKGLVLRAYSSAIVGGARQTEYLRFLGFTKRRIVPGYDTVDLARIRAQGGVPAPGGAGFADRPFVFVGRFVDKKNLATLLRGYAAYRTAHGGRHRLVLVGDGEGRSALEALAAQLGIAQHVEFAGFRSAPEVAEILAGSLALCLVSTEEQWGLVVNEALAFNLPALVSTAVGSRDALVRNGVNGMVVEPGSEASIAAGLAAISASEEGWKAMVRASTDRAWLGDTQRFADAVEALVFEASEQAAQRIAQFRTSIEEI